MPTDVPRSVRQALGEEASEDFARWFDESLRERTVPRDEYREVLSRLDVLERSVEQVEKELSEQRRETAELRREMNERFDRMNGRFDQMHEQMRTMMRWTVGTVALIGVILSALLAIAEFAV